MVDFGFIPILMFVVGAVRCDICDNGVYCQYACCGDDCCWGSDSSDWFPFVMILVVLVGLVIIGKAIYRCQYCLNKEEARVVTGTNPRTTTNLIPSSNRNANSIMTDEATSNRDLLPQRTGVMTDAKGVANQSPPLHYQQACPSGNIQFCGTGPSTFGNIDESTMAVASPPDGHLGEITRAREDDVPCILYSNDASSIEMQSAVTHTHQDQEDLTRSPSEETQPLLLPNFS